MELVVCRLDLDRSVTVLSPQERTRAASISHDLERRRYLASHETLRRVLSAHTRRPAVDIRITRSPGGKPRIDGAGPHFSLSRREDWCAVALSDDAEVGVDLEVVRPFEDEAAVAVASLPESLATPVLEASAESRTRTFYRSWCAGEAAAKAAGLGMAGCRRALAGTRHVVSDLPPDLVVAVATSGPHLPHVVLRRVEGFTGPASQPAPREHPAIPHPEVEGELHG